MTNFHMPRTTLLLMVESFIGVKWRAIYEEAIEQRYRMLSFGDAMLLYRGTNVSS
jgi:S-adenosylmethionine:tRNA ribosyltransferase-isomerase